MENGYVSLHRKLVENPIYSNSTALHCWIHCLLKATYKERDFYWKRDRITLKPGQFITGRDKFGEEINIPSSTAWYWLERFESDNMIDIKRTSKGSVVTINKWEEYQKVDSSVDNEWTTNEQRMNTYNKDNKVNKDNKGSSDTHALEKNTFKNVASLTPIVLEEISEKYEVPLEFVENIKEDLELYVGSTGKRYKDYRLTLMAWVSREKKKALLEARRSSKRRGGAVDVRSN